MDTKLGFSSLPLELVVYIVSKEEGRTDRL